MAQALQTAPAISSISLNALLSKNWGPQAKAGGVTWENATVTAGTPITLADTVNGANNGNLNGSLVGFAQGPGVITNLWSTCNPGNPYNELSGVVNIYVDGETTPSVSYDLGGPLGWYQTNASATNVNTRYFMCETQGGSQFAVSVVNNWFLPIPFKTSVVVKFTPSQTSANFFFHVSWVSGLAQYFPFKLKSQVTTWANSVGAFPTGNQWTATQLGNGSVNLLSVGSGISGYIAAAWLGFFSAAASIATAGNCDINTYLNGNTPGTGYGTANPDISAAGMQGFFRHVAIAGLTMSSPQAACSNVNTTTNGTYHALLDIAAMDGCWRFTNGAIMQIESGQGGNGGNSASIFSGVLYYVDIA